MKCVYLHINEIGVFYVGCGGDRRPQNQHKRSLLWKQVALNGYSVWVVDELEDQQDAWKLEKELIAYFKPICNKATGGQGATGCIRTPETREKMSVSKRGDGNPSHKLTEIQVLAIREDTRIQAAIAKDYGISPHQVSRIKSRKKWNYL